MLAALVALLRSPFRTVAIAYVGAAGVAMASMIMLFLLTPEGQVVRVSLRAPLAPLWGIPEAIIGSVDQTLPTPPLAPASIAKFPPPAEALAPDTPDTVTPPSIEPVAFSAVIPDPEEPGTEVATAQGEDEEFVIPSLDVPEAMTSDVVAEVGIAEVGIEESEASSAPVAGPESVSESTPPVAPALGPALVPAPPPTPSRRQVAASSSLESPSRAPSLPAAPAPGDGQAPLNPAPVARPAPPPRVPEEPPQREPEAPPPGAGSVIAVSSSEGPVAGASVDARGRASRTLDPVGISSQAEDGGRPCDGGCDAATPPSSQGSEPDHGPPAGRSNAEAACRSEQSRGAADLARCSNQPVAGANSQVDLGHDALPGQRPPAEAQLTSPSNLSPGRDDPPPSRGGPSPKDAPGSPPASPTPNGSTSNRPTPNAATPNPATPNTRPGNPPENRLESCPARSATGNANSSRAQSCASQPVAATAVPPPARTPGPARPNAGNHPSPRR